MIDGTLRAKIHLDATEILASGYESQHVCTRQLDESSLIGTATSLAVEDLCALAARDAAAGGDVCYVYESYRSYQAVLAYRVSHQLCRLARTGGLDMPMRKSLALAARRISENAKVVTGIDIHPAAEIGRRFVIDHGTGTVVGEQVEMGDDCYLQNVILGGRSIGFSSSLGRARRHPRIGDRVEIGGDVMVFGPVTIGHDCLLEPGARVTSDIPPNSRVRVISTLQVTVADQCPEIHGLALVLDELLVSGHGLAGCMPVFLDSERNRLCALPVDFSSDAHIRCRIPSFLAADVASIGFVAREILVGFVTPIGGLRRAMVAASVESL